MSCSDPPPLSDETISAALDDDTPPAVLAHLQHCPECAGRLEEARQLEHALQSRLARWDCPPPAQLSDYHLGLVPPVQQRSIAAHLEACAQCSAEVEELRVFLAGDAPAEVRSRQEVAIRPGGVQRLRALVAELLPRPAGLQMAAVRGAGDAPILAQSSAATIVIEAQKEGAQAVRLIGQIADEAGEQERWDGALVEIRQADTLVAATFVDEVGGFSSAPVPTAQTELRITAADGTWIILDGVKV